MSEARAAVIGSPIAHSLSPALHRAAYEQLGLVADYTAIEVTEAQFPAFLDSVLGGTGPRWGGLSVTMPLKRLAAAHASWQDANTRLTGVANTLTFDGDASSREQLTARGGSPMFEADALPASRHTSTVGAAGAQNPVPPNVRAYNTDIPGIVNALKHAGVRELDTALILGGGGTALAALAALAQLGATRVELALRDIAKASEVVGLADRLGVDLQVYTLVPTTLASAAVVSTKHGEKAPKSGEHAVVLSTLPPRAADPLARHLPETSGVLLDVAYDPWPSALAKAFERAGGTVISGKEMLAYQAMEQVRLFWGLADPLPKRAINAMCDAIGIPRR